MEVAPQTREGGAFPPRRLSTRLAVVSWRGGGSTGSHRPRQRHQWDTGPSMHELQCFGQGSRASRSPRPGGMCSYVGPQKNRGRSATCLGLMTHSRFRLQPGMTSGTYADNEGSCYHLARIRPYSVRRSSLCDFTLARIYRHLLVFNTRLL